MKSIMQNCKECYICRKLVGAGMPLPGTGLEEHHVFGGTANRRLSERYGLKVWLCHAHHNEPPEGVHHNKAVMQILHEEGQLAFERSHPNLNFREIFGANYRNVQYQVKHSTWCYATRTIKSM